MLTHPPYSLVDDVPWTADLMELSTSGTDAAMEGRYGSIAGLQTLHARLSTLAHTVQQVVSARHQTPSFGSLKDADRRGVVGTKWEAGDDRDNRGKVYLYFCPEDMTVALQNVQGIGWQGVPDHIEGSRLKTVRDFAQPGQRGVGNLRTRPVKGWREPMREIGAGFFQRVFTAKRRPDLLKGKAVKIGAGTHDFALRVDGETSFEHAANMAHVYDGDRIARSRQQLAHDPDDASASPQRRREGWRTINGEPLRKPVEADLCAGGIAVGKDKNSAKDADADKLDPGAPEKVLSGEPGSYEWLDPVDAAVAVTSRFAGRGDQGGKFGSDNTRWLLIDDPTFDASKGKRPMWTSADPTASPHPATYAGSVVETSHKTMAAAQEAVNEGQPQTGRRKVLKAYECLGEGAGSGKLLLHCTETPDETRLRWQQSTAPRSFHSAIFGSRINHRNVTSYDVAVAQGKAPTDPRFNAYLCAVADWRLKDIAEGDSERARPGILN